LVRALVTQPWNSIEDEKAARTRAMLLPDFAGGVLARRHKKVLKRGRGHADLRADELHRLRIEIKKLRYAAEFLAALYDEKGVREYTDALAGLQGLLGNLNDAATVQRLCDELREGLQESAEIEAVGVVRGWATGAAQAHMAELPAAWNRLRECEPFWER
jgi:CHAD domain-containing protein